MNSTLLPYGLTILKCVLAVIAGLLLGNGAVYFFDKMPASWLTEYGKEPSRELQDPDFKRIRSIPWKYLFSMFFIAAGIWLAVNDWQLAVAALPTLWLLLELSLADLKYRIVPNELTVLLAVCAIGYIVYHDSWQDMLWGGALGLGIMLAIALLGRVMFRQKTLGGGDIKLAGALGLIFGFSGILLVLMAGSLAAGLHSGIRLLRRKTGLHDTIPLAPYLAGAAGLYLIFLYGNDFNLLL